MKSFVNFGLKFVLEMEGFRRQCLPSSGLAKTVTSLGE